MNLMSLRLKKNVSHGIAAKGPILSLQYLRAFAAFAVVAAHGQGIVIGQAGVDIFFVISGFIMWMTISKNQSVLAYAKNRIIRIIPLYWIATILMGLHQRADVVAVLKSMLFIPYTGEEGEIWPVLVQGWTLNFEMFFYLLITFILFVPNKRRLPAIITIIGLLSLCGSLYNTGSPVLATYTNTLLVEFCFGIGVAELWFRNAIPRPRTIVSLALTGMVLACLFRSDALPAMDRFLVWGLPSALLVAAALSLETAAMVPRINLLLILGDASYAIYLFHTFSLKTVIQVVNSPVPGVNLMAVIAVSAATGVIITRWIDKPLLNSLRTYISPRQHSEPRGHSSAPGRNAER